MTTQRTLADALRWSRAGTRAFVDAAVAIPIPDWAGASLLPGWTRSHVVAHVAANADAIRNLARWAVTGEPTPMYASPEARTEGIAQGDRLAPRELVEWLRRSADLLDSGFDEIHPEQWSREVVTAQGRTVPASETAWMRAREVWVHAVDLSGGVSFADLPEAFVVALRADIIAKRGEVPAVTGPPAEVVAYLAGRPARDVMGAGGGHAPALGPWL